MEQLGKDRNQLNELVISAMEVLHKPNIEGKFKLLRLLRKFVKSDFVDFHHRFKANVAINLLVEDIQTDLDAIKRELLTAA